MKTSKLEQFQHFAFDLLVHEKNPILETVFDIYPFNWLLNMKEHNKSTSLKNHPQSTYREGLIEQSIWKYLFFVIFMLLIVQSYRAICFHETSRLNQSKLKLKEQIHRNIFI